MILYPAVDIRAGRAVRLRQGDYDSETVYADDPLAAAGAWVDAGARALHVVDLDGAREGTPQALDHLRRIAATGGVPVQYGGGLRTVADVEAALAAGAQRVVLGTAAYRDVDVLDAAIALLGDRLVVSVDARRGVVAEQGWTHSTSIPAPEVIGRLGERGVRSYVYSSIERDGTLEGPDLDEVRATAAAVRGRFLYSGGIATLADLEALVSLRQVNLAGAIVGSALYERRFTIAEAQAALDGQA